GDESGPSQHPVRSCLRSTSRQPTTRLRFVGPLTTSPPGFVIRAHLRSVQKPTMIPVREAFRCERHKKTAYRIGCLTLRRMVSSEGRHHPLGEAEMVGPPQSTRTVVTSAAQIPRPANRGATWSLTVKRMPGSAR